MTTVVTYAFTGLQYFLVILMAPLTLAVCAGVLVCTHLIARQLHKPTTNETKSLWLGRASSEWLGA
ncbi:MAG: hypothetical protein KF799_01440 [Bdellovibrionales bacterium]|nr:hypothetical protein [Bdellovibrionales bacterium]